jgi:hypothetical protein
MPIINNGSEKDRINKLQQRTIYSAYLIDKAAVDDKVLVKSSFSGASGSQVNMKEGALFFTPEELNLVLQNNATTSPVGLGAPLISGTTTSTLTSITFAFTPPTNDGGEAISDYRILGVTLNYSRVAFTIDTINYTSNETVTGLLPGTITITGLYPSIGPSIKTYIISLVAFNIKGNSSPLLITKATASATVAGNPEAGTGLAGSGGGMTVATTSTLTTITFSFTAPSNTGGIPITGYTLGLALGSSAVPFTIGSTNYLAGQTVSIASPQTITISGLEFSTLSTTKTYNISIFEFIIKYLIFYILVYFLYNLLIQFAFSHLYYHLDLNQQHCIYT